MVIRGLFFACWSRRLSFGFGLFTIIFLSLIFLLLSWTLFIYLRGDYQLIRRFSLSESNYLLAELSLLLECSLHYSMQYWWIPKKFPFTIVLPFALFSSSPLLFLLIYPNVRWSASATTLPYWFYQPLHKVHNIRELIYHKFQLEITFIHCGCFLSLLICISMGISKLRLRRVSYDREEWISAYQMEIITVFLTKTIVGNKHQRYSYYFSSITNKVPLK